MSTIKADTVTTKSDDTDLTITGGGTGVPNLEAGFKVGGSVGVPTASIQDDAVTTAKILNDNVTLAKLASGTDGELITWDASGDPATVGVGTATHVLTSNGAGAAPTFQAAGGGAWAKVASSTGATDITEIEYTSLGTKDTWIRIRGVTSATFSVLGMRMRIAQGGTFVDSGTGYNATGLSLNGASAPSYALVSGDDEGYITPGISSIPNTGDGSRAVNIDINIYSPGDTSRHKNWSGMIWRSNDDAPSVQFSVGSFDANTTALSGFKLYCITGSDVTNWNYTSYEIMELN